MSLLYYWAYFIGCNLLTVSRISYSISLNRIRVSLEAITERLGQTMYQALPFLHAFTGSDTTSTFQNMGKKKGYDILKTYDDALETFSSICMNPFQPFTMTSTEFKVMQRFVVLMYSKASEFTMANEARKEMFFQKNSNLDVIPPTENALFHHCQRAIYQTGVWGRCLETYQSLPVPSDFGGQRSKIK